MEVYQHVFVEKADYKPESRGRYHIYHNCGGGGGVWRLELISYIGGADEDLLFIDEMDMEVLYPILKRHVPGLHCNEYWNPIKPQVYREICEEIIELVECVEKQRIPEQQPMIDFCKALLWYYDECKEFRYDIQERILNLSGW